ncbi:condensin-2 complex subunit H2 isoform X2 [Hevea brasiliensis]|uniref:condensin-2 complex subunit H2 isoform X2 n=1 Tax=Hevea brasiliensis TaxID=3981 RepID=UPI000B783395|nr:condensin-2 complex subunit H2 isoform X2 [Hevea brasiliensis]
MTNNREPPPNKIHTVQAERNLGANWEVDLATKLEDYLLKICSGEITGAEDYNTNASVNFAEAALLLQGSVQVYSRKVEYLYNLVLHALEFLSEKRQQEQSEGTSVQPEQSGSHAVSDEENDQFWCVDVPVEARNSLDASTSKDASFYHFVKPPANLIVLEGDCLDTSGDGGELESYLLATNDLYRDFILLDPCDAVAVNDFLKGDETGKLPNSTYRGSSTHKNFQSPTRRSGGTARKSSLGKNLDANLNQPSMADCSFGVNNSTVGPDLPAYDNYEDGNHDFDMDDGYSEPRNLEDSEDDDSNDDPWKPLNPHEPGNLKMKPFGKVKPYRRNGINSAKQTSITTLFPLAKMDGTISPELIEMWKARHKRSETNSQSPPLYEKLRQSLSDGGNSANETFGNAENDNEANGYDGGIPDFEQSDDEMPESMYMDEDLPQHEKYDDSSTHFDTNEAFKHEEPSSQASLEDLCLSHLDALLANIAETEKQTELATRVSLWKQKIERNLEEQENFLSDRMHALHLIFMPTVKEFLTNYLLKQTVIMSCPLLMLWKGKKSMMWLEHSLHFFSW